MHGSDASIRILNNPNRHPSFRMNTLMNDGAVLLEPLRAVCYYVVYGRHVDTPFNHAITAMTSLRNLILEMVKLPSSFHEKRIQQ